MTEFADRRLTDLRVHDVGVARAAFWKVRVRGAWIRDVEIDGQIEGLRVNGVDVGPLVEAELDRRDPRRVLMRSADVAGLREAWEVLEQLWAGTIARARALPPERLHQRVDGEWSFVETLRHLLFVSDVWVSRALLGDPRPWDALSLPFDEMEPDPGVPWDRSARPGLEEVLALRAERAGTFARVLDGLTPDRLASLTEPVEGPGYPPAGSYPVLGCLQTVLSEEWQHRLYAERDLDALGG